MQGWVATENAPLIVGYLGGGQKAADSRQFHVCFRKETSSVNSVSPAGRPDARGPCPSQSAIAPILQSPKGEMLDCCLDLGGRGGSGLARKPHETPYSSRAGRSTRGPSGNSCSTLYEVRSDANFRSRFGVLLLCRDDRDLVCGSGIFHSLLRRALRRDRLSAGPSSSLWSGFVVWHGRCQFGWLARTYRIDDAAGRDRDAWFSALPLGHPPGLKTCKFVSRAENREKYPRWSWVENHLGNPG